MNLESRRSNQPAVKMHVWIWIVLIVGVGAWFANLVFLYDTFVSPRRVKSEYIGGEIALLIAGALMILGLVHLQRKEPKASVRDCFGALGSCFAPLILLSSASSDLVKKAPSSFTWSLSLALVLMSGWVLISIFGSIRRLAKQELPS